MKFWKLASVTTTALFLSSNVSASIVELGNINHDTETGLEWLDVTETRGMSYNDVLGQMQSGGTLEGFRYATSSELDVLIHHLGFGDLATPESYICAFTGVDFCVNSMVALNGQLYASLLQNALITLGDTRAAYEAEFTDPYGDVGSTWGVAGYGGIDGYLADFYEGEPLYARLHYQTDQLYTTFNVNNANSNIGDVGSFLVQTEVSAVPVPAAVWLFGSGLIGLFGFARRKKT